MSESSRENRQDADFEESTGPAGDDEAVAAFAARTAWPKRASGPVDYIAKHWRGELSLAKSYWVNTILLSIPFTIMISSLDTLSRKIHTVEETAALFWALAALTVFVFPLTVWQLMGTWRSASRRTAATGKSGWSTVAKVLICFGWLQLAGSAIQVSEGWPVYKETALYTLGLNPMGDYKVEVIDGGAGVAVRGAIARGLVDDVRAALDRAGDPSYVVLDSVGGRIGVAASLNRTFQERGLITLVQSKCYSACALAFLGGRLRVLGDGAVLGFHQSTSGLKDSVTVRAMEMSANAASRDLMHEAGVHNWFIDQAMETPSEQMWTPPIETLAEADVITHTWSEGKLNMVP